MIRRWHSQHVNEWCYFATGTLSNIISNKYITTETINSAMVENQEFDNQNEWTKITFKNIKFISREDFDKIIEETCDNINELIKLFKGIKELIWDDDFDKNTYIGEIGEIFFYKFLIDNNIDNIEYQIGVNNFDFHRIDKDLYYDVKTTAKKNELQIHLTMEQTKCLNANKLILILVEIEFSKENSGMTILDLIDSINISEDKLPKHIKILRNKYQHFKNKLGEYKFSGNINIKYCHKFIINVPTVKNDLASIIDFGLKIQLNDNNFEPLTLHFLK